MTYNLKKRSILLTSAAVDPEEIHGAETDIGNAFGLLENAIGGYFALTEKGRQFFEWLILNDKK